MPGKTADIAISPEDREWLLAALRHLRQTLEQRLEGCDLTPERRRTLLAAGEQALSGTDFAALDPGFALFLTEDRVETLPLGEAPPQDISAVGHRFLLRPILDRLSAGKRFHILAMSAGGTRLIEATPESSRETTPSGLPQSLSEVAAQTDAEITSRANAPGRGDAGEATSATRHSYESPAELHKTQLVDYVRHSVNTVRRHLAGDPAPWGGAGVAYASPDGSGQVVAVATAVRSTHGAGDCFIGVLAAGLARGLPLQDAIRRANAAAGHLVSLSDDDRADRLVADSPARAS